MENVRNVNKVEYNRDDKNFSNIVAGTVKYIIPELVEDLSLLNVSMLKKIAARLAAKPKFENTFERFSPSPMYSER